MALNDIDVISLAAPVALWNDTVPSPLTVKVEPGNLVSAHCVRSSSVVEPVTLKVPVTGEPFLVALMEIVEPASRPSDVPSTSVRLVRSVVPSALSKAPSYHDPDWRAPPTAGGVAVEAFQTAVAASCVTLSV